MATATDHLTPGTIAHQDVQAYILAGNAVFTIANTTTGNRLTYRVRQCADKDTLYFVQVLTGADNTEDYTYLGTIRVDAHRAPCGTPLATTAYTYYHGKKSRITPDAISAKAFRWLWEHRRNLPACVEVYHEGRCGRCGRALTVPESVASGYGPECIKKVEAPLSTPTRAVGW